jgi:tetratricopeptide (TPR) repeat protein
VKPATAAIRNLAPLPAKAMLNLTHEYPKWNNCGPVSLGVVATYFGIARDQFQAAAEVKGAELDKNVGVDEMQSYLEGLGLRVLVRVNGSAPLMMRLVASGFPVIVHQWLLKPNGELVGHYRVVQGYDQAASTFTTSDPYTPPRQAYSFADFERFWQPWNHRYIAAYRPEQAAALQAALGDDFDSALNVANALRMATARTTANPKDPYEFFSLGDDRLAAGDISGAIAAYDQARALGLPEHFAWYNFGPYDALHRAGAYQRMLDLSTPVLKDAANLEEIHFWRGKALLGLGQKEKARAEFALAVQLNAHYAAAKAALAAIA